MHIGSNFHVILSTGSSTLKSCHNLDRGNSIRSIKMQNFSYCMRANVKFKPTISFNIQEKVQRLAGFI